MQAEGIFPELPPNPAPYLSDWLFEIGPSVPAGMGAGPIGWRDMEAWQSVVGVALLPWEGRLLRRLSAEFLDQSQKAKSIECPAPWAPDRDDTLNREAVGRKVGNALKALALAQRKGGKREGRNS